MASDTPKLLAGGNPQIPKGEGEAPIQAYLDAVPGWKQAVCRELDQLISEILPDVKKAMKWNTPLYGLDGKTWITAYHCTTKYVKVTFFMGAELDPLPPETSKQANIRYLHVFEDKPLDVTQFTNWIRQASQLPGAKM